MRTALALPNRSDIDGIDELVGRLRSDLDAIAVRIEKLAGDDLSLERRGLLWSYREFVIERG